MLQREAGSRGGQERIFYVEFGPQPVGESRLFYGDVLPDEFKLFSEGNFIHTMSAQRRSQHFAQLLDDAHGGLAVVVTHEHGDSIERVEEEVRIHLRLKRGEARVREDRRSEKGVEKPIAALKQQIAHGHRVPPADMRLGDPIDGGEPGGQNPGGRNQHPWSKKSGLKTLRDSHPVKVLQAEPGGKSGDVRSYD